MAPKVPLNQNLAAMAGQFAQAAFRSRQRPFDGGRACPAYRVDMINELRLLHQRRVIPDPKDAARAYTQALRDVDLIRAFRPVGMRRANSGGTAGTLGIYRKRKSRENTARSHRNFRYT